MPGIIMENLDDLGRPPVPQHPTKFADLYEVNARLNQQVNIMGVVVDFMAPSQSRGSDMQCSFTLHDPISWLDDSDVDHSIGGLKVKFFAPDIKELPRIQTVGDIVLLRNIGMKQWQGSTNALSNRGTKWTVFPGRMVLPTDAANQKPSGNASLAQWSRHGSPQASSEEEAYAIWLRRWSLSKEFLRRTIGKAEAVQLAADPTSSASVANSSATSLNTASLIPASTAPVRNRFISLSEASDGRFCDVVAEVIKVFETGMCKEVYITDYTENNKFFNYPHPHGKTDRHNEDAYMYGDENGYLGAASVPTAHRDWPGPWGQFVMCVGLFHPHSSAELKEHDLVSIRNLRCVNSKDGSHLEGKLHGDRRRPDQIDISKIKSNRISSGPIDNRLTALRERKEGYWRKHGKGTPAHLNGAGQNHGLSKAAKKRDRRRKRDDSKKQQDQRTINKNTLYPKGETISNPDVRCSDPDKEIVPLADIIDGEDRLYTTSTGEQVKLPFVNRKCRVHVRVVDFYPPNIEDFARLAPDDQQTETDDDELMSPQGNRWEWAFYLLVEDAQASSTSKPDRLKLLVAGGDADFLLKLDAGDLRKDRSPLKRLKYRLSKLWGDMAEIKAKHEGPEPLPSPSNVPFECCIEEYGVPEVNDRGQQNWTAAHRLVRTTVSADDGG